MVWLLSVCPVTVQTHMWKNRRSVCCAWLSLVAAAADVGKWCRENPAWLIDTASGNVAVCMKTDTDLFRKNCSKLGYLWRRKLNNSWMSVYLTSVLFFSHPQSEVWPHDRRTFPIYLCPLSFWLTLSGFVVVHPGRVVNVVILHYNSPDLNPLDYHVSDVNHVIKNYHKLEGGWFKSQAARLIAFGWSPAKDSSLPGM